MKKLSSHWLALGIVLIGFALMAVRSFQTPMWIGYHHERDTYLAARITAENRRFPTPDDYPPGQFEIQQGSQPPLHALFAAAVVSVFDDGMSLTLPANPVPFCIAGETLYHAHATDTRYNAPYGGTVRGAYALRLLSAVFVSAGAWMTYLAGRALFPDEPRVGLLAAALVAFGPYHVWLGSRIINDSLLVLVAATFAAALGQVVRMSSWRWSAVLWMLGAMALAGMTKLTGWVLIAIGAWSVLMMGGRFWLKRPARGQLLAMVGVLAAIVLLVAGLALYNQQTTGSVFGRYSNLAEIAQLMVGSITRLPQTVAPTLRFTLTDYGVPLAQAELSGRVVDWYERATALVFALGFIGVVQMAARRQWADLWVMGWLGLVVLGAAALVVLRNHIAFLDGNAPGSLIYAPLRYYVVGMPALSVALAAALLHVIPSGRGQPVVGIGAALGWLAASLLIIAVDPPTAALNAARVGTHTPRTDASGPYVLASALDVQDGGVALTLDMGTSDVQTTNWLPQVTLSDASGTATVCQFVPTNGYYPVARWEAGETVREDITVYNCNQPMSGPVDVRLDWLDPQTGAVAYTDALATLDEPLPLSQDGCPPNFGRIGDELQIVKVDLPERATRGGTYEAYLDYVVLNVPLTVETRRFSLERDDTTLSCEGLRSIHGGALSFGTAREQVPRGNRIYLDSCLLEIPTDAPDGEYRAWATFEDADGDELARVELGAVTVRP